MDEEAVIPMVTAKIMYEVPLELEKVGMAETVLKRLNLKARQKPDWTRWEKMVTKAKRPEQPKVKIALVGKYVELHDAYMSVREALNHAGLDLGLEIDIDWVHSVDLEKGQSWDAVTEADGIVVPGGFGGRGIEGKIQAACHARTNKVPYLGLCLGMQLMVIEFGREVLSKEDANSTEFSPSTPHPVIDLMPDQRAITDKGATMRLGLYPCELQAGSKAAVAYGQEIVQERHRHRFEFNNAYREEFEKQGMSFSGISPDNRLVEIAELVDHPFMVGTQFHPEFLSRPTRPHPLFKAFVEAAAERAGVEI